MSSTRWVDAAARRANGAGPPLHRWLAGIVLGQVASITHVQDPRLAQPYPAVHHLFALVARTFEQVVQREPIHLDLDALDKVMEKPIAETLEDETLHDQHARSIAYWLCLELLHGDAARIAKSIDIASRISPAENNVDELIGPLMVHAGARLTPPENDTVHWTSRFLEDDDAFSTCLHELRRDRDPHRWNCLGSAQLMDRWLTTADGRPRVLVRDGSWSFEKDSSTFRFGIPLDGTGTVEALTATSGPVFWNPWRPVATLLDKRWRRTALTVPNAQRILENASTTISLDFLAPPTLLIPDHVQAGVIRWFEAGLSWVGTRYPWFKGTFECRFQQRQ